MAEKQMRAVQYDSYGGGATGLKQVEVHVPTPSKGEVLITVEATSLNPVDWKIQKGMLRPIFPKKFPFIPATDVGGEVVDVGPEVKKFTTGNKIVTGCGLAEWLLRPPEVSTVDSAGLPIASLTAHMALTKYAELKLIGLPVHYWGTLTLS